VDEDWTAVAKAVNARAAELALKQRELADSSGVSIAIIREIQQGKIQRRRNPRTLEALSLALGWHSQHLTAVLHGQAPPSSDRMPPNRDDPALALLRTIVRELRGIREQIGALSERIDGGGSGNGGIGKRDS
jgi:transcriptional regulator with XRE-family HTH domain